MRKKYFKPEIIKNVVFMENSIVSASIDTGKSMIQVEREIELTDQVDWNIDLEA